MGNFHGFESFGRIRRKNTYFSTSAADITPVRKKNIFWTRMREKNTLFFRRKREIQDEPASFRTSPPLQFIKYHMHSYDFDRIRVLYAGLVMLVPDSATKKKNFKSDVCGTACACERGHVARHNPQYREGPQFTRHNREDTRQITRDTRHKLHETHKK